MNIEIKNYRACAGRQGEAYSFALWCDGRHVADVRYDGAGGAVIFRWLDRAAEAPMLAFAQPLAVAQAEREEASARAKNPGAPNPPTGAEWGWWPNHLRKNPQAALESHLHWAQEKKNIVAAIKRRVKKAVLVVRAGQAPGEYFTVAAAPTAENVARIARNETAKKGRVINTLPESEWLSALGI